MKKIILTIALLISVINIASAQFTVGPKVGLNKTKEHFGKKFVDEIVDFKTGINAGFFGKYTMNDKLGIQTELLYSQQGYKGNVNLYDNGGTFMSGGFKYSSHYFNIPLVLKYYPIKRLYIEAGPQIGFCLNSKISPIEYTDESIDTDYNTIDFSLVGGIGYNIVNRLSVNARYSHGFSKTLHSSKWQNRVIQISLAYDLWDF